MQMLAKQQVSGGLLMLNFVIGMAFFCCLSVLAAKGCHAQGCLGSSGNILRPAVDVALAMQTRLCCLPA